ncbi:hypothetical protein [Streptomyces sp. NPDC017529]|uniref:hypothetical protein n=1 Tax=Streptomyces sp. NPDC017529 TaxID=3365000 RepID=UPI0037BD5523
MALPTLTPQADALPDDLVSLEEAVALLRLTPFPTSITTLRRWTTKYRMDTYRCGRRDMVSYSDVLVAHRDENQGRAPRAGW